jgi:hypothetical protein
MRSFLILLAAITLLSACEKVRNPVPAKFTAVIAGYDLNCSTCILSFPFDSLDVRKELGYSSRDLYQAVNLNKNELQIGEMLKVEVRKPEPAELTQCITLYPSSEYETVFVTKFYDIKNFNMDDTILLSYQECRYNSENKIYICFESVTGDSRCPEGAQCVWAGNANIKLKFYLPDEDPVFFDLNTNTSFLNDSIIKGYRFTLLDLQPYPSLKHHTDQNEYQARVLIRRADN